MNVDDRLFGTTMKGDKVFAFEIGNSSGLKMTVITYGATLQSFKMPDRNGREEELTLGFETLEEYEGNHPYFGSTIGRTAGRISNGSFSIDGTEYNLDRNDGGNTIHGGSEGFSRKVWDAYPFISGKQAGVKLFLESEDGDQGYPGTLTVNLTISLDEEGNLIFLYNAGTDKPTPVNFTNHTYWNLAGAGSGKITEHFIRIESDKYLETNDGLIPTGRILPLSGTSADFSNSEKIGDRIPDEGFDHYFLLNNQKTPGKPDVILSEQTSGRMMELTTDCPGLQFYTGNFLNGIMERNGTAGKFDALCLEPGEYPDAVNHNNFPDPVLRPGNRYSRKTIMKFIV